MQFPNGIYKISFEYAPTNSRSGKETTTMLASQYASEVDLLTEAIMSMMAITPNISNISIIENLDPRLSLWRQRVADGDTLRSFEDWKEKGD
jgi:hypothetical protein